MPRPGRNDPCPCGSGKKFKRCCLARQEADASAPDEGVPPPHFASAEPTVFLDDIDRLSNHAVDLIEAGRLEEAEEVCRRLLEEFPDLPDGLVRTAAIHEAREQRREAAQCYRRAADLQLENDPEFGHELATHYRAKADALEAELRTRQPPATDP